MFPIANGIPLRYPPIATWALIATNAVVFLFEVSLSPAELNEFLYRYAPGRGTVLRFRWVRQLAVA